MHTQPTDANQAPVRKKMTAAQRKWYRERYAKNREKIKTRIAAQRVRTRSERWLDHLVMAARARSVKNPEKLGICTLDQTWITANKQTTKCALTGVALVLNAPKVHNAPNPQSPSLDRLDPTRGYTPDNVRIVCHWANIARSTMTDEQFKTMVLSAAAYMRH